MLDAKRLLDQFLGGGPGSGGPGGGAPGSSAAGLGGLANAWGQGGQGE